MHLDPAVGMRLRVCCATSANPLSVEPPAIPINKYENCGVAFTHVYTRESSRVEFENEPSAERKARQKKRNIHTFITAVCSRTFCERSSVEHDFSQTSPSLCGRIGVREHALDTRSTGAVVDVVVPVQVQAPTSTVGIPMRALFFCCHQSTAFM